MGSGFGDKLFDVVKVMHFVLAMISCNHRHSAQIGAHVLINVAAVVCCQECCDSTTFTSCVCFECQHGSPASAGEVGDYGEVQARNELIFDLFHGV